MKKHLVKFFILINLICLTSFALAQDVKGETDMDTLKPKILIAYYSYSGNTRAVAEAIRQETGGVLFEIKSNHAYPESYRDMTKQAQEEIKAGFRPVLTGQVDNMGQYDVVFIGSPNWWGTITPHISSFLAQYDLNGKTVVPFITHGGGGVQNTVRDLSVQCKGCKVSEKAWVGYGNETEGVRDWIKAVKILT